MLVRPREQWVFRVYGMRGEESGLRIDDVLCRVGGVTDALTSSRTGLSIADVDPDRCTPSDLVAAIAAAGYAARLDTRPGVVGERQR
ncbi:MAG: hypothetical protein GEU94_08910 [Micromonosporaceae bacterium]|nr:hypothetical protein [Micromonosporaceae bacterium]